MIDKSLNISITYLSPIQRYKKSSVNLGLGSLVVEHLATTRVLCVQYFEKCHMNTHNCFIEIKGGHYKIQMQEEAIGLIRYHLLPLLDMLDMQNLP